MRCVIKSPLPIHPKDQAGRSRALEGGIHHPAADELPGSLARGTCGVDGESRSLAEIKLRYRNDPMFVDLFPAETGIARAAELQWAAG